MIDFSSNLVSALTEVLPTYYEMALTKQIQTPCISYMEINNYVSTYASNANYSRIVYQIKVWGNRIADLQDYAQQIDEVLRPLGFVRISSGELYDNQSTMIQKILTYEALGLETY